MTMTPPDKADKPLMPEMKYWWSDDEEIIRSDAFDTREDAYSDAYCSRATCFDDPSQQDGFWLHYGKMVANPDYDADYAKHYGGFDDDNCPQIFEGKTERVEALTVTDYFHDQWVKLCDLTTPSPVVVTVQEFRDVVQAWNDGGFRTHPYLSDWLLEKYTISKRT